ESTSGKLACLSRRPTSSSRSRALLRPSAVTPSFNSCGSRRFSSTVRVGIRLKLWNTNPMRRRRKRVRSFSDIAVRDTPSTRTSPAEGASSPPRMLSRVLFPDPLRPIRTTASPGATERFAPRKTTRSPASDPEPSRKDLSTPRSSMERGMKGYRKARARRLFRSLQMGADFLHELDAVAIALRVADPGNLPQGRERDGLGAAHLMQGLVRKDHVRGQSL